MRLAKTNFAEDRQALLDEIPHSYTLEAAKDMKPDDSNETEENSAFNGAELSESVLGRDWNSKEEDAAWSNL